MKSYFFTLLSILFLSLMACNNTAQNTEEHIVDELAENTSLDEIQVLEPVKWEFSSEKLDNNQYKLTFNATIDEHWYVYSNAIEGDGPIPTTINFDENEIVNEVQTVEESGEVEKDGYDELFDMNIKKFGKTATFSQIISVKNSGTLTGYLEYMTCDSIQCLFPDPIEFTVEVE